MVRQVLIAAVIHIVWKIWLERNARYFNDKPRPMEHLIHSVIVEVGCSFRSIRTKTSAMLDWKISHLFRIPLHHKTMRNRAAVCWLPPAAGWTKINIYGSCFGLQLSDPLEVFSETLNALSLGDL